MQKNLSIALSLFGSGNKEFQNPNLVRGVRPEK